MKESLKDQLIKAGLVSKDAGNKPVEKIKKADNKRGGSDKKPRKFEVVKSSKGSGAKAAEPAMPAIDKELKNAIKTRLHELKQNDDKAEELYYFQDQDAIKRVYVTEEQRQKLLAGNLVVAIFSKRNYLVGADFINELKTLSNNLIHFHVSTEK